MCAKKYVHMCSPCMLKTETHISCHRKWSRALGSKPQKTDSRRQSAWKTRILTPVQPKMHSVRQDVRLLVGNVQIICRAAASSLHSVPSTFWNPGPPVWNPVTCKTLPTWSTWPTDGKEPEAKSVAAHRQFSTMMPLSKLGQSCLSAADNGRKRWASNLTLNFNLNKNQLTARTINRSDWIKPDKLQQIPRNRTRREKE